MGSWLRSLRNVYLTADPRSLGLFRIGFGVLLFADLAHRYRELELWYTNAGLLPNHTLLWRPPAGHMFSLFFVASTAEEAQLGFGLCALCYVLFTLGYRTQLFQFAAAICRISLNSRLAVLENGGDMVINLLCVFTLALPLGRRFSIDAWLMSLRSGRARTLEELNALAPPALERQPVVSLAMLGLLLQFAAVYFFNAVSKQGDGWTSGQAVHYALHQDKMVTGFGVWMREHLSVAEIRALTWATLCVEWTAFALIITPFFVTAARLWAVCMLPFLHLGFASGLNLGLFTPAMLSFYPLLLTGRHWDAVARWLERRTRAQTIELTVNDPALLRCARVVRELDRFGKITWRAGPGTGVRVCSIAERAAAGEALRACSSALPWGFAVAWLLRLPGLRAVAGLVVRLVLSGVRASRLGSGAPRDVLEPAPRARRAGRVLLEGWVVVLSVAIASEIVNDNTSVPPVLHVHQPAWAKAVIEYPRLLQGWRMFAPEPARTDSMIYVDATTSEGKHVDPYNAVASRQPFPAGEVVPERMDQSQFFVMYSDRIGNSGYAAYRQAFLEWLLAYPQRSGSAADCLIAFDVYLVTDQSPLPGTHASATRVSRDKFMEYKAPASGDCHPVRANARPALAQRDLRR